MEKTVIFTITQRDVGICEVYHVKTKHKDFLGLNTEKCSKLRLGEKMLEITQYLNGLNIAVLFEME